jgi:serine/threonine protein kinase
MTLSSKLTYLKFIAEGIKFLKDHEIVHLDIKPSNLLFGFGIVKITDFGESFHPQICQKSIFA